MSPVSAEFAFPEALSEKEKELLRRRNRMAPSEDLQIEDSLGVALSGGGIRSATFCLGVFQALAKHGKLRCVDYLSTVSGGGYFGSFFGALFHRSKSAGRDGENTPREAADVEEVLADDASEEMHFLRENGRYLAPSGSGDLLLGGAVLIRNLLAIHLVLLASLITLFLGFHSVRRVLSFVGQQLSLDGQRPAEVVGSLTKAIQSVTEIAPFEGYVWWSPWIVLPVAFFLFWVVPTGWAYWLVGGRTKLRGENKEIAPIVGVTVALILGIAWFGVWLYFGVAGGVLGGFLASEALITIVYWRLANRRVVKVQDSGSRASGSAQPSELPLRNELSHYLKVGLVITGLSLIAVAVDSLGQTIYKVITADYWDSWISWTSGFVATLTGIAAAARRIAVRFGDSSEKRTPLPLNAVAWVAAMLLLLFCLIGLSALSHGITWGFGDPRDYPAVDPLGLTTQVAELELATSRWPSLQPDRSTLVTNRLLEPIRSDDVFRSLIAFIVALVFALLFGHAAPFLNRSSHHALYSARLTRAYLGASNPKRLKAFSVPLNKFVSGDDIETAAYWRTEEDPETTKTAFDRGSPLHLINVTVNETVSGESQIQQQDRKGVGMCIGPCGLSLGAKHHAVLNWSGKKSVVVFPPRTSADFKAFDGLSDRERIEKLSLGKWVGISGAAFTTGVGYRTSLGLSFLAGLGNIRLGYWWDPGVRRFGTTWWERRLSSAFPTQFYLLSEFFSRFPGTSMKRWYLSDGGHFENMGAYELVRRRLRQIIIIDAEADPDYEFGGLSNLVRKARVDFGADIEFVSRSESVETDQDDRDRSKIAGPIPGNATIENDGHEPSAIGRLEALCRTVREGNSRAHAAIARITYKRNSASDGEAGSERDRGWLLYIKPTLIGDESVDLREYHSSHSKFPHEPTADQFFDEAQWESYRKLGEHIGGAVFSSQVVKQALPSLWFPREGQER